MGDKGKKPKSDSTPVMVRMPNSLLERIDAHAKAMEKANPGVRISRGDSMRSLILSGLDKATAARAA